MSKLKKSEGILISNVKYGESSLISKIFSREDGLRSFIISGVRSRNNKGRAALFQPGQILDMDYYYKEGDSVIRLKEATIAYLFHSLQSSIVKIALSQYYIEIVKGSIYHTGEQSFDLYDYIREALVSLDQQKDGFTNMAPAFLWKYIPLLGLAPNLEYSEEDEVLDLQEGQFIRERPIHNYRLTVEESSFIKILMQTDTAQIRSIHIPANVRKNLLDAGHAFLKLHLPYFTDPSTPDIFREILIP